jgi:hypothetical protein
MENMQDKNKNKTQAKPQYTYAENVIYEVELLSTIGKSYRRKLYKLNDIIKIYIDNMIIKWVHMGEKYINDMIMNINNIFRNASIQSKYDILEFINSVILYSFKHMSYKYTKNKIEPKLPDYTLPEIKDLSK